MLEIEFDVLILFTEQTQPLTQCEIASKLSVPPYTINKTLAGLTEKNYIASGTITPAGMKALEPYRVKRAIFLAAGFGSRLIPVTFNTPKPLVRVNGIRMIDTLLDAVVAAKIPEIVIVRGYLSEQFDQLLCKYPRIRFVENSSYNVANNIGSAVLVRHMLQNAYVLEADLVLKNPRLIRTYEYSSNFLGIPVDVTDDWCFHTDKNGVITSQAVGGEKCYQMVGISYWNATDGSKLANDIEEVFRSPGGRERYWEQTPMLYKMENYRVQIRKCTFDDVIEIDTFGELIKADKLYAEPQ